MKVTCHSLIWQRQSHWEEQGPDRVPQQHSCSIYCNVAISQPKDYGHYVPFLTAVQDRSLLSITWQLPDFALIGLVSALNVPFEKY